MRNIKDRIILGIISGLTGGLALTLMDTIFFKRGVIKSTLRNTAARIYVTKKEANTPSGKILGIMVSTGFSITGGLAITGVLTKTGTDHLITKGIFIGITSGSIIPALMSGLNQNKIKAKDAKSNLSYLIDHALYGIVVILTCFLLGHPSLFDEPLSNADA